MTEQPTTDSLREQYAATIRPNMLMGLQDAELDGPGGTQRINEWADWIAKELAEVRDREMEQLRADLDRVQQAACRAAENRRHAVARAEQAEAALKELAPMFEGLHRLIATSSRNWPEYRVDAWLWAVLVGWDCEEAHTHDETCEGGSLQEIVELHGWNDEAVAKARRYRAAVAAAETRG